MSAERPSGPLRRAAGGLDRRELLLAGASAAGVLAAAPLLAACGGDETTSTKAAAPTGPTDLTALGSAIEGEVVLPASPDYKASRLVWDARFDDARPTAVIKAANLSLIHI